MEESDAKICQNCKREIPAVNYTIHTVHCARNIRVCPVCKEPVLQHELQEHHEKLHKLLPCKQCGESVCGTDLEDHIRDSCGHTIKSCRFCELELPRRELPAHENYCGVRTEHCADCGEWVMIKYRQLHLDSNHGFLRLNEDPVPQPKKEVPKPTNIPTPVVKTEPIRNFTRQNGHVNGHLKTTNLNQRCSAKSNPVVATNTNSLGASNANPLVTTNTDSFVAPNVNPLVTPSSSRDGALPGVSGIRELKKAPQKRTNDQPQINTAVATRDKVVKDLPISRGAIKKRVAPKPPPVNPQRDLPYYSALQRSQEEERQRRAQSAYNASIGLPPVLSPAAKLDKLRKMDALQNREVESQDYKNKLQGRVWMSPERAVPLGNRLGSASPEHVPIADAWGDFKDLKPMSPQEFTERFKELQLERQSRGNVPPRRRVGASAEMNGNSRLATAAAGNDRFSEIKSSLRELRRGLNEVTAPYNSNPSTTVNNIPLVRPPSPPSPLPQPELDVQLPCEFCGAPVAAEQLVLHQTGCRPDLAQFRPRSQSQWAGGSGRGPGGAGAPSPGLYEQPVIPCEFCTESLPVYLISEHQERCRGDYNFQLD
ncbi:LOW QUALITY PROTEIN: uncharacterized protein ACR2FA_008154 [Aphomia sociella]